MSKLCCIYNSAAHYRGPVFRLMDETWDIDWHFGTLKDASIKQMDIAELKNAKRYPTKFYGRFSWMKGYLPLLFKKEYNTYFALGESYNISGWLFLFLCKLFTRKKIYYWTHGFYGKENRIEALLKKIQYGLADGVFPYGDYSRELMIKHGLDGNKIWSIHNSLDYDKQLALRSTLKHTDIYARHFGNDRPVLVFIGRLTAVKRLDLLIDALAILHKQGNDYNLALIGDGSEREKLEKLAKERGVKDSVWFYGACYDEATNGELIYNADLCVAPGNIGLTAMHVMAFGTPAATHNNFPYQMPEFEAIHEGITGTFFDYNNPNSIAMAIQRWFELPGKDREKVRQACYHEIDTKWNPHYQIEIITKHLPI